MDLFNRKKLMELETRVAQQQNHLDILTAGKTQKRKYTGNEYKNPALATKALAEKYEGLADWGVQQVRNIIDLRAAFTIGNGMTVSLRPGKEAATRELEFIQHFIEHNDLDDEMAQDFAKEAELEGKFLCHLSPRNDIELIDLRFVAFTATEYTIHTADNDYNDYIKAEYKDSKQNVAYKKDEFVYGKFAGRAHKVNEIKSKTAMVLTEIEDLDRALRDWRIINKLFASPTPYFKCETAEDAATMNNNLKQMRWNIGKYLCGTGEFSLVTMSADGISSLEKEIVAKCKIISGATGIPVHFLGLPELMSNRAVSTDLFELISASTNKERRIWAGTYKEIFKKALLMANARWKKNFDVDAIDVDIPYITTEKLKEIVDIWLPLYDANAIDHDTLLSKIPEIDSVSIKKNVAEKDQKRLRDIRAALDREGDIDEG